MKPLRLIAYLKPPMALTVAALAGGFGGCGRPSARPDLPRAEARILATSEYNAAGIIRFRQTGAGTEVTVELTELAPGPLRLAVFATNRCDGLRRALLPADHHAENTRPILEPVAELGEFVPDNAGRIRTQRTSDAIALTGALSIVGNVLAVIAAGVDEADPAGSKAIVIVGCGRIESRTGEVCCGE